MSSTQLQSRPVPAAPVPLAPAFPSPALLGGVLAAGVLCALPFLVQGYLLFQLTMVTVYAIAVLGLNLLTGFNGQISVGHGAFYGIGAYVAAVCMDHWDMPYWQTPFLAAAICLGVGYLFGLPALRLRGPYLALATLALATAFPQLLKYKYLQNLTGGSQGISILKPEAPFGLPLDEDQWLYFVCLAFAAALFAGAHQLIRSRIGDALVAIRENSVAAEAMGINIARYKALTFAVSAAYTGVAGALGAIAVQFVAPDSFNLFVSITFLVGVVVGGLATVSGAVWGALFIEFVPNVADQLSKSAPWAVYGVLLIACILLMPAGVAGLLRRGTGQSSVLARARRLVPGTGKRGRPA